jgi:GNAT superfamily N-acetyltransferase
MLLCVAPEYRRQGIGTWLLEESEKAIRGAGYDEITVGVGDDYITPGIPTGKRYAPAVNECLDEQVDEAGSSFFEKRGYVHDWGNECNCFDMKFPLCEFTREEHDISDAIDGICYRFATIEDRESVSACTDAACEDFTKWYQDDFLYTENKSSRVLVAVADGKVVGTLMVDTNHESGLGSVGCTAVHPDYRGKHIAVNMVILGTKYLRDVGMKEAYLSYTYSGLDHMYGYAGYKIFVYFMMAKKKL